MKALAKKLPKHNIDCNQSIQSIKIDSDGLKVEATIRKYQCKHIIYTLPPLLFAKTISTEPALPEDMKQLMLNTHTWMQDSIRVGITYKNAFWQRNKTSGTIYSSAGPIQEFYDHSNSYNNLHALGGFISTNYSDNTKAERKTYIIKQLQIYYGDQALDYNSYEECAWRSEKHTTSASDKFLMPQTNNGHPLFKETYLNNRLFITGAETSAIFSGKMEGAITSAQFVFEKLKHIYNK
ncbi:FAD-dependent oxidoreductase [Lacinutrix sp.]|uniref:FAD-dependent oxidoreductase n=1 Tax=Lacinutrix sp. TaxID=1937692 RepID=UPI0025BA53F3|nr:FAD-dependent oxidoreductase [Lacinutrix sp.]